MKQTIAQRIYSILNRSAKTRYELAAEVRKPVTTVCGVLKTLEDQGLVFSESKKINKRSGRAVNAYTTTLRAAKKGLR